MKIDTEVLKVLDSAECDGSHLRLVGQLDRKLYVDTNKVLEAAGGKWNRGAKAHIFDGEAADAIEQVILTGEIATPQEFGFFETPPEVLDVLLRHAELRPGLTALEPSAGRGRIAGLLEAAGCEVTCVELQPQNVDILLGAGYRALCADFLALDSITPRFNRIVMNPPFARQADIDHVTHALDFLAPGGRLVSVMSLGVTFRANRKTLDFVNLVEHHGGFFERLPEDAFKPSGTLVQTVVVVIPRKED